MSRLGEDISALIHGRGEHVTGTAGAVPGRCQFDSHGWLQGPISITHMLSPNHYDSGFAVKARGMVQHTEDGYTAGTIATFMSRAEQVSAFFGVGEDGAAQQFLPVGQGYVAWAEGAGNPYWRSTEFEDKTRVGTPMTAPQLAAGAQILEACSAYDGFPLQITDDPVNGFGLITHGDGGVAFGDHPGCPGDVRRAQRPELIRLAKAIRDGTAAAPAAGKYVTTGRESLVEVAAEHKTRVSVVIRLTLEADGHFPADIAGYLDGANLKAPLPKGAVLHVPA